MSSQAELVKDSLQRIQIMKSLAEKYPNDESLKILISEEQELLDKMEKIN